MSRVLHIMFDVDKREFVGASVGGKMLGSSISSASLSPGKASLFDFKGWDILGGAPVENEHTTSSVATDIATCFGARDGKSHGEKK